MCVVLILILVVRKHNDGTRKKCHKFDYNASSEMEAERWSMVSSLAVIEV